MEIQKRILGVLKSVGLKYTKINFDKYIDKKTIDNKLYYFYNVLIPEAEFINKSDRPDKYMVAEKLAKAQKLCSERIKSAQISFNIGKVEMLGFYDYYDGVTIECKIHFGE